MGRCSAIYLSHIGFFFEFLGAFPVLLSERGISLPLEPVSRIAGIRALNTRGKLGYKRKVVQQPPSLKLPGFFLNLVFYSLKYRETDANWEVTEERHRGHSFASQRALFGGVLF